MGIKIYIFDPAIPISKKYVLRYILEECMRINVQVSSLKHVCNSEAYKTLTNYGGMVK